jgi:hypothetical protein
MLQNPVIQTLTGSSKGKSYDGDYMLSGRFAEEVIWLWLEGNSSVIGIEDFRHLRPFQNADVDAGIQLRDGRVKLAEIKSDRHLGVTDNVLFEVLRINHNAPPDSVITLGWGARSPAQYLLYYASSIHQLYVGTFKAFRKAVQQYTAKSRKGTRFDWVNTDTGKSTLNILIPWFYCRSVFKIYELPNEYIGIVKEKLEIDQ